jgi:archaellum component FlaC
MKRLNINFIFLILAVLSLLFLEGGLLFRVFGDYLGENLISSLIGVICMQCGFFAISLNSDTNEYRIPPQWLFVVFGQTLLVCYNIYHVIELLPTLKSNGLPQYIIGIATGLFIPFLGGLLLDLLAAKMKKIEGFKVWKDTLYELAKEESRLILEKYAKYEKEIQDLCNKRIKDIQTLLQEIEGYKTQILGLQQEVNDAKKHCAEVSEYANNNRIKHDAVVVEMANLKTEHANELLRVSQEKGKDSGELARLKAREDYLTREVDKLKTINSTYEHNTKLLHNDNVKLQQMCNEIGPLKGQVKTLLSEKEVITRELNELRENFTANSLYEKVIVPWNRGMKIGKNETTKAGETRYSLIEKELGPEFLPIVYSLERGGEK